MANWSLYLIECRNGSLYCGVSTDVERRAQQHALGKGSKAVRMAGGPKEIRYRVECGDKSTALRAEIAVKQMSRQEKFKLIADQPDYRGLEQMLVRVGLFGEP